MKKLLITTMLMAMVLLTSATAGNYFDDSLSYFETSYFGVGTSTPSGMMEVQPTSAITGLTIDQNYDGVAIEIDSEANNFGIYLNYQQDFDTYSTIYSLIDNSASDGRNMFLRNDGTGNSLFIDQNGNGRGLNIDHEGATTNALYIASANDGSSGTVENQYAVMVATTNTGGLLRLDRDNSAPVTRLANFVEDHPSANIEVVGIKNDGTGNSLFIDQNGNGDALNIESSNTNPSNYGLTITKQSAGRGVYVGNSGSYVTLVREDTSGTASNWFFRDLASATTASPVMFIEQDNSGDDQVSLKVQQDGTGDGILINSVGRGLRINQAGNNDGIFLDNDGNDYGMFIDNAVGTNDALRILNDGTNNGVHIDQNGNGAALYVENSGTSPSVQLSAHGGGIQMESPDGTIYCLTIANGGTTSVSAGACTA